MSILSFAKGRDGRDKFVSGHGLQPTPLGVGEGKRIVRYTQKVSPFLSSQSKAEGSRSSREQSAGHPRFSDSWGARKARFCLCGLTRQTIKVALVI
jgi:hypothetical protein